MYRTAATLLIPALGALLGCSEGKRIPAIGPGYEIVILSPADDRALGKRVATILSKEIRLVRYEPTFATIDDALEEYSFYRTRKLLFAVAPAGHDSLVRMMKRATGTEVPTSFPGLWVVKEPFAAGQVLLVLTGERPALVEVLTTRGDELLEIAEETAVTLLLTNLFRAGEMAGARERMLDLWGWGVRLPPEWVVDDRFASQSFVRVWRDGPVAQLFVSWEPGRVERSPQEWLSRRDELTGLFYQGDMVSRVPDRVHASRGETPFGIEGVVLSGLWENEIYVIGGPFASWTFHCPQDDRTYFVDISVYAPDRDKRPLMRMLEAVVRTFRCGCVAPPPPEAAT
jgi:hypothetical protein